MKGEQTTNTQSRSYVYVWLSCQRCKGLLSDWKHVFCADVCMCFVPNDPEALWYNNVI